MADVSQPSPLTPALERAHALVAAGDLAEARALLERAVELGRENLGEDDPDVLATVRELAAVHRRADDPMAARRALEEAYAAGQWRLGDSDPLLLQISYDLGVVAEDLGNRHEARKAFGRVAGHGPAVLGARHWAVTRAQAYLNQDQSVRDKAQPPPAPETVPQPPAAPAASPEAETRLFPPAGQPTDATAAIPSQRMSEPGDQRPGSGAAGQPPVSTVEDVMNAPTTVFPLVEAPAPDAGGAIKEGPWAGPPQRNGRAGAWVDLPDHVPEPRSVPPGRVEQQTPARPIPEERQPEPQQSAMDPGASRREQEPGAAARLPGEQNAAGNPWSGEMHQTAAKQGAAGSPRPDEVQRAKTDPWPESQDAAVGPWPGEQGRGAAAPWPGEAQQSADGGPWPGEQGRAAAAPWPSEAQQGADGGRWPEEQQRDATVPWPDQVRQAAARPWPGERPATHDDPGGMAIWQGAPAAYPVPQIAASALDPYPSAVEGRRRGMALFAVVAATLAAVVAVAALVFVLADRARQPAATVSAGPSGAGVPTLDGLPPGSVRLDDQEDGVEVSWSDPAQGRAPFIVTMARPGEQLKPVSQVGPGQTSFRMSGLNENLDYCFVVVAVYATDRFASSEQVCTRRSR